MQLAAPLAALTLTVSAVALVPAAPDAADGPPTLDDLAFLTGSWRAEVHGSVLEEHLAAPRHGSMVGTFRWMSEGATTLTEHIVLEQHDDGVHYFLRHFHPGSVPWEQEADGPMHFRLREVRDGTAVFESEIDFPRRLVYRRQQPDTLVVSLEGTHDDGSDRRMQFNFRRTDMSSTAPDLLTDAGQSLGYNAGMTLSMPVKDLERSIRFYEEVVGFKLQYKLDEMGWCELTTSVPGLNVGLSQVESPKVGEVTPTFGVDDIDRARQVLEERGAKFDGPTQEIPGMVKLATFYDPDGNSLMLYQQLAESFD